MTRTTRILTALFAAIALLAIPAASQAKTYTFGIRLDHEPSNSAPAHNCNEDGNDDPTPACTRVALDVGDAVPGGLRAPRNGTIVKLRVRAGTPGSLTFRLVRLQRLGFNQALGETTALGRAVATGPTVQLQGLGFAEDERDAVEEFPAHLKVHKGDYLAIDSTATSALYCSGGGANQMIFAPALGGALRQSTQTDGCELLVQAVMKPARKHR